jgi:serine protease Do
MPERPSPRGFEDVVARVKPAVFGIRAMDEGASTDDEAPGFLPRFGETPEDKSSAPEHPRSTISQGSGFFISSDGYAVTTNHVIEHGTSITIETDDGNTYPARLVASDPQSDIALLKVDGGSGFKSVEIADQAPRIGEWVIAVGNPFGLGGTVTAGIVSARSRDITPGSYNEFIQIDAPVNQGNSGGPTFDVSGKVIGINSAIVPRRLEGQGKDGARLARREHSIPSGSTWVTMTPPAAPSGAFRPATSFSMWQGIR